MTSPARAPGAVRVHWRPGCPYCAMLRLALRSARVPAKWVNICEAAAAAEVREISGGDETVPTVVVGRRALVNPSARQVAAAVRARATRPRPAAGTRPRHGWRVRR
jgi:mycoredoxin